MIVDRHRAHAMLTGSVTEYRIPWRPTRTEPLHEPTMLAVKGRSGKRRKRSYSQQLPKPGQTIAIRTEMFGDVAGEIEIVTCHQAPRHDDTLTPEHLAALGYPDTASYIQAWLQHRDTQWLARRAPEGTYATTDTRAAAALNISPATTMLPADWPKQHASMINDRWHSRWAGQPIYIVTFAPANDIDYFLAGPPRVKFTARPDGRHMVDDGIRDQDRGYTGDGVRPVPTSTDLEDRGITTRPAGALTDAGCWQDPDSLSFTWANGAALRHEHARGRKHRVNDRAKRAKAA